METAPFELDEILCRYLSDIEFEYDMKNDSITPTEASRKLLIIRFISGSNEDIDHRTEERFMDFSEFFSKKKILQFHDYESYWEKHLKNTSLQPLSVIYLRDPHHEIIYTPFLYIEVLKIDEIRKFRKTYCFVPKTLQSKPEPFGVRFDNNTKKVIGTNGSNYAPSKKEIINLLEILWPKRVYAGKKHKSLELPTNDVVAQIFNNTNRRDSVKKSKQVLGMIKSINSQLKKKGLPVNIKNTKGRLQVVITEK